MSNFLKRWGLLIWLFWLVVITILILDQRGILDKYAVDGWVLLGGNLILFLATVLSIYFNARQVSGASAPAAVRGMYLGFMLKFFILAIAAFAYIMSVKKEVNKPALIICGVLYFIYTFVEVLLLTRLLKQRKNA